MKKQPGRFKAVILAGGSGERFWPLSTPERPKQFLSVFGKESLLRASVSRLKGLVAPEDVFVITSESLVAATRRELPEVPRRNIVGEPVRRDTGAAVALGTAVAGEGTIGFFSSDQLIARPARFRAAVRKAAALARRSGSIVTLGITPTYPSTAFGYVNPANGKFVEKPDAATAAKYVKAGFLWNAGMFIAGAETFREAFRLHAPALAPLAAKRPSDLVSAYEALPKTSFDYAVMEKASNVAVVPGDFGWDDVGGYGAFERYFPADSAGNIVSGDVKCVESGENICITRGAKVALFGVEGLVVAVTKDAVLVAKKSRVSEMKKLFAKS